MAHIRSYQPAFLALFIAQAVAARPATSAPHDAPALATVPSDADHQTEGLKERMLGLLPESVSDGLDFDAWAWLGYLQNNTEQYWDAVIGVGLTKSFGQSVAVTFDVNFISANETFRVEMEQGFLSARLSDSGDTILTFGKFNAGISAEPRDFWTRRTGTASLLFGAQPQDLLGLMISHRVGDSPVTIRPFITNDFQGSYTLDQPPAGGVIVDWDPCPEVSIGITNMVGPGYVVFGGEDLVPPYPNDGYGYDPGAVVGNWQGPNLIAERAGTLYFFEAHAIVRPCPGLQLTFEYLLGSTGHYPVRTGWQGWMMMANFDVTDRMHVYGRWSYLDDHDWLITGFFQRRQEFSVGGGYFVLDGLEVRAEFRYDTSNSTPDTSTWSIHLAYTF